MKTTRISAPGVLTAIVLLALLTGCSSRSRLPVYDPSQVGTVMTTEKGEVVSVRDVLIKPQPPAGSSTGAIIGAGVGQTAATGSPGAIGGAVGSVIGATVGGKTDERMGEELTILVEGGNRIVIVQERSVPPLAPGEKVEIITGRPATSGYPGGIWGRGGRMGLPGPVTTGGTRVVRDQRFAVNLAQ